MNYGELIKDAFWLTLRNRFLWFFGFFAGGTSAGGGNFSFPSGGPGGFDDDDFDDFGEPGQGDFGGATPGFDPSQWIFDNLALILAIVALVALIALFFIVMSLISQGALTESVAAIDRGESRRFSTAFRAGLSNFWRVLGYYLLFILIALGLLLLIVVPLALLVVGVFAGTESVGARVLTAVLAGLIGFVLIGSGYRLFRRNLGKSLLVWLIQLAVSIGIGIALLIIFFILALILIGPGVGLLVANYTALGIPVLIVGGLIFLAPLIVALGVFGTFGHSYWTLAYLRLVAPAEGATPQPEPGA
jgi:hypothetical protein